MNAANINYIKVDFTHKKLLLTGVKVIRYGIRSIVLVSNARKANRMLIDYLSAMHIGSALIRQQTLGPLYFSIHFLFLY